MKHQPVNLHDPATDPDALITLLGLTPHPEGGHYREIWRDSPADGSRGAGTAIYYLLRAGERSRWHRVDAAECWHFYGGDALALDMPGTRIVLGPDLAAGQVPFAVVPPGIWQTSIPLGRWSLMGCTVSPAFSFAGLEMAPPGWVAPFPGSHHP